MSITLAEKTIETYSFISLPGAESSNPLLTASLNEKAPPSPSVRATVLKDRPKNFGPDSLMFAASVTFSANPVHLSTNELV